MPTNFEIAYKPIGAPKEGENGYAGFHPGKTTLLKAGTTRDGWNGNQTMPLKSDIILEHDVECVMRDGTKLYTDIYRPADAEGPVPLLVMWSPYGKRYTSINMLPVCTWHCGILDSDLSGWEKFEGLDPARWCPRGYAIASVDHRGAGNSEGSVQVMGKNMGEDGYDVIEALAKKEWCSGNVGMAGNSYLAISQYFIAVEQPPSLKALAPWEGCGDLFREQFVRGGVFDISNFDLIAQIIIKGHNGVEDFAEMYHRQPLTSPYWEDKRPDLTKIKVPTYITGSDFSSMHSMGAVRAYMQIDAPKWIRWAGYQEWHDLYAIHETNEELMEFFDHFLKGVENNFVKDTPKVRWTLLQHGDREPICNVPIPDYPVPNTDYKEFYLAPNGGLSAEPVKEAGMASYLSRGEGANSATFDIKFDKKTQLIGLPKIFLHMSCDDHDDMNVFVVLKKLDVNGKVIGHLTIPRERAWTKKMDDLKEDEKTGLVLHPGSHGVLRASHRYIDHSKDLHEQFPWHPHDREEKIPPGQIVRLEIGIWTMGTQYDAGESLRVDISGGSPLNPELARWTTRHPPESTLNKGTHKIHFGGEYDSRVILPFVEV